MPRLPHLLVNVAVVLAFFGCKPADETMEPQDAPDLLAPDGASGTDPDLATMALRDLRPGTLPVGTRTIKRTVAGMERSVILHVPAAAAQRQLPLVIALHGNGDRSENFVAALGLVGLADSQSFILIAPQGITQTLTIGMTTIQVSWDAYRAIGDGNIDLPLLEALRSELVASGSVEAPRVVVFGYSQGGYMAFRYGIDAAPLLSCADVAAAANPLYGSPLVKNAKRRIAVALQIGTLDSAINNARATRDELSSYGHPVQYNEIAGAGHVPFPGSVRLGLDYCLTQTVTP
jgi:poly(3-hydroxybutyrate) depolymerase